MSHPPSDARARLIHSTGRSSPVPNGISTPIHENRTFSPIRLSNSGSFTNSSMTTTSSSSDSPQNSPSPGQSSLLSTSTQEIFEGSFTSDTYVDHGENKLSFLNYVNGVKVKTPAEYGRSDHTAVLHDDSMYIYGGVSVENNLSNTIHVFNFASRAFSAITPAVSPKSRYQHTAVVSDNLMLVFGGGAETSMLNDLVVFSFDTQIWGEIIPSTDVKPSPRRGHSAALVGRTMFIFGGYGDHGPLNDMYKFDLDKKSWALVTTNGTPPQPRFLHSSGIYKNELYIFGGTNIDFVFGDMFVFNCDMSYDRRLVKVRLVFLRGVAQ